MKDLAFPSLRFKTYSRANADNATKGGSDGRRRHRLSLSLFPHFCSSLGALAEAWLESPFDLHAIRLISFLLWQGNYPPLWHNDFMAWEFSEGSCVSQLKVTHDEGEKRQRDRSLHLQNMLILLAITLHLRVTDPQVPSWRIDCGTCKASQGLVERCFLGCVNTLPGFAWLQPSKRLQTGATC